MIHRDANPLNVSRRSFLHGSMAACAGLGLGAARAGEALPPSRAITRGPKFHWFGYYDKLEFDPSGRFALGMEAGFEHRSPSPDDTIRVGMVDLQDSDRWIELGNTSAWCWQQGCMLQWLPGSREEVIWNDRDGGQFIAHVLNVATKAKRTIPAPVYAVSPDARWAVAPDFGRLHDTRPGYGYAGVPDLRAAQRAPDDTGIHRVDLGSGKSELILTYQQIAKIPYDGLIVKGRARPEEAKHWVNHLLVSPDGSRFVFLHRWKAATDPSWTTRMISADPDGKNPRVVNPSGMTSHFIWRDPGHILGWALNARLGTRFCLFDEKSGEAEAVGSGVLTQDGHCTYLPGHGNRWVLNDTYPDRQRNQNVHLFDTMSGKVHPLGAFHSPAEYTGEWRCDTHPRSSPDGKSVVIDTPHGGHGRQLRLIDVSSIVDG